MLRAGGDRRRVGLMVVLPPILIVALGLVLWPAVRTFLGLGPRQVLVIYVREENSLGLLTMPSPGAEKTSGLDLVGGRLILPRGATRVPGGARAVVLREVFVAGLMTESRASYIVRYPDLVSGRSPGAPGAGGVDTGFALLGVDLVFSSPGTSGGGPASVRVEAPGLVIGVDGEPVPARTLEPEQEWRLGAVMEDDRVLVLAPEDPAYEALLRQAFYDNRPVSVISVLNCGLWDTDAIEIRDDLGG